MRIRIHFSKTNDMRYTGHLDLHKTWERTVRRSGLPLAYSQGFKPHPRINLACALPLGFTSSAEIVDIYLEQVSDLSEILDSLNQAAPPGIRIEQILEVEASLPALQATLESSEYEITLLEHLPELAERVNELLKTSELIRQRQGKTYNLRPLIHELRLVSPDPDGCQRMIALLAARNGATGRPEEVILALGGDPTAARVHRSRLNFS